MSHKTEFWLQQRSQWTS